jgi:DnaK suppressor protein
LNVIVARQRLDEVRDELEKSIAVLHGEHDDSALVVDYPQDAADAGTHLTESDRSEAVLVAAEARRTLVLAALRRLDDGSYGLCVDCGRSVPEGRLEAKPEAARCVTCQAKRDRLRR